MNYFTASFHDSVLLLCSALEDYHLTDGKLNAINGRELVQRMRNMSFSGISGNFTIDSDGDRITDYALLDQTDPESGLFRVLIGFYIIY